MAQYCHLYPLSIRRFISRTRYPRSILNNNGTYFVSAQQEPSKALQKLGTSRIKDELKIISYGSLVRCLLYGWLML